MYHMLPYNELARYSVANSVFTRSPEGEEGIGAQRNQVI